jgi:hypothetical protein
VFRLFRGGLRPLALRADAANRQLRPKMFL